MFVTSTKPSGSPRQSSNSSRDIVQVGSHQIGAVETPLGWIAVAVADASVAHLTIGHHTRDNAIAALPIEADSSTDNQSSRVDHAFLIGLLQRIKDYGDGVPDDFRDVKVDRPDLTPFGRKVIAELRKVGYGEKASYGELAERAGSPRAARAVGRVMATNRIPLILPCHRIVGSGGRLGGFSAPQGISLKQRLLDLESRESDS